MHRFTTTLQKPDGPGAWTVIVIPFDVGATFGRKGYVKVKGTVDGTPFAGTLMPLGEGKHCLPVKQELRDAIGKDAGEDVVVELAVDDQPLAVPPELVAALDKNPSAQAFFVSLTEAGKRQYVQWINNAKQEKTRWSRIEKAVEKLASGLKFND